MPWEHRPSIWLDDPGADLRLPFDPSSPAHLHFVTWKCPRSPQGPGRLGLDWRPCR